MPAVLIAPVYALTLRLQRVGISDQGTVERFRLRYSKCRQRAGKQLLEVVEFDALHLRAAMRQSCRARQWVRRHSAYPFLRACSELDEVLVNEL